MTNLLSGMRKLAVLLLLVSTYTRAQDMLPEFSAVTRGNGKIIISWSNPYKVVSQISIQRSRDSTKGFASILSVPDPTAQQNGFVDSKAPDARYFYRLFIVLDSGKYVFTKSRRAAWDTAHSPVPANAMRIPADNAKRVVISEKVSATQAEEIKEKLQTSAAAIKPEPEKFFYVKRRDSLLFQIPAANFKRFRDSVVSRTRDTIAFSSIDTIVLKPFVAKEAYRPSKYVYTERDGNVAVVVPNAENHNYSIKFFTEDDKPIFEVGKVRESPLLIDKANFMQAGWFKFELYEDGKVKERHKLFVPKDF
jgi:hypothetical protein